MKKVVVVDDSLLVRKSFEAYVANEMGMQVVGSAGDGGQGLRLVEDLKPDLLLTDLIMPVMNGQQLIEAIVTKGLGTRIVVISASCDEPTIVKTLNLGAHSFISKPVDFSTQEGRDRLREGIEIALGDP